MAAEILLLRLGIGSLVDEATTVLVVDPSPIVSDVVAASIWLNVVEAPAMAALRRCKMVLSQWLIGCGL